MNSESEAVDYVMSLIREDIKLQGHLADLNMLPEQLTEGTPEWNYMLLLGAFYGFGMDAIADALSGSADATHATREG